MISVALIQKHECESESQWVRPLRKAVVKVDEANKKRQQPSAHAERLMPSNCDAMLEKVLC